MEPWMWMIGAVVLLVIATLSFRQTRPKVPTSPAGGQAQAEIPLSADEKSEIDRLVAKDEKIRAIKRLREMRPMGLAEAKRRVESWTRTSAPATLPAPPSRSTEFSPEFRAQIDELLAAQNPIQAIKLVRTETGLGLAEAKAVIDRWS